METDNPRSLLRAFLIQASITAITVVSGIATLVQKDYLWVGIVLAILMIGAQYYLYHEAVLAHSHRFKSEDDEKFSTFFTRWYLQEGEHRIFCKDLDWLDKPSVANVRAALESAGSRVKVYVSDDSAQAADVIRAAGGEVYRVPYEMVKIQMKFSLHSVDSSKNLIVRRKRPGTPGVKFSETRDRIIIGLAQTVMAACHSIASPTSGATPTPAGVPAPQPTQLAPTPPKET